MAETPTEQKPWDKLRLRAADQTAATFVNPEGGIEVFQRDALGDQQQRALTARGLKPATPEDIEKRAKFLESSTTEQQTRAAIELGLNTATAGAIGKEDLGQGAEERRSALEQASPTVALGARVVGSAIPMALTGGAAGALGAGATVVGAAEGVGAALAEDNADAAWHNRELNAGNIAIAGLGGALFGAAIPAVLRRGSKALAGPADAVAAVAGEVGENVGVQLEAKAAARAAGNVDKIPPGPARDALLVRNAPQHLEQVQSEVSDVVARAPAALEKSDIDKATLKRLMPKDAPNQTQWATDTAEQLRGMAGDMPDPVPTAAPVAAAPASPVSLAGKSLEDLKALPIEGADDLARVASLKAHPEFAAKGTVPANDAAHGITLVDDGGETVLRDGRHRLTAAQELDRDTIRGRVIDGKTGKVIYEGEIPLKAKETVAPHIPDEPPIEAPPPSGIRANPEELGFIPHSKSGRRSIKRYESDMARIEGMTPEERVKFDDLLKEHAAVSRISPFGPGNKAKLYELQKDILEEHGDLFPKRKAPSGTPAAPTSPAPQAAAPSGNPLRDAAASLLESKGALDTMQRARSALRDLRAAGAPQEAIDALQKGISDQALFGRAAEAVADFDAAHARVPNGALEGFDPGNLTQASREKLTAMAEALEDRAAARAKWDIGGAKDKESQRLLGDAARIRKNLGLADDVASSLSRVADMAPKSSVAEQVMGTAKNEAIDWIIEGSLSFVPGGGLMRKAWKTAQSFRKMWSSIDASGQSEIKAAARKLARGLGGETVDTTGAARVRELMARQRARAGESGMADIGEKAKVSLPPIVKGKGKAGYRPVYPDSKGNIWDHTGEIQGGPLRKATPEEMKLFDGLKRQDHIYVADEWVDHLRPEELAGDNSASIADIRSRMAARKGQSEAGHVDVSSILKSPLGVITGAAAVGIAGYKAYQMGALELFSEGFPGPQEAFAARSAMLADMVRDPTVLPNAMAESFGDLPRENPQLFQQMATRMARATQYVTANLPVGIATSLAYPRGVPPSQSSLREFAVVWNSAMDPGSVIDAVASGSATPSQVRTLQSVDPDVYQSLTQAVTQEVGNNYAQMPAQTKQWLDILFQSDGIAGPGFSWKAATYMSEGEKKNPRQPMPMGKLPPPSQQAPEARGISAIQRGVTNAG